MQSLSVAQDLGLSQQKATLLEPAYTNARAPHQEAARKLAEQIDDRGERYEALLVPKDAVVRVGPQEQVFRIKDDGTVEPIPVQIGQGVGEWLVVAGPLAGGDRVVTRGNERLQPGQAVRGEPLEYPVP